MGIFSCKIKKNFKTFANFLEIFSLGDIGTRSYCSWDKVFVAETGMQLPLYEKCYLVDNDWVINFTTIEGKIY